MSKNVMEQHVDHLHRGKTKESTPCPHCDKKYVAIGELNRHIKCVHMNIRSHNCGFCDKKFRNTSELREHQNAVHKGIKYPCKQCNTELTTRSSLNLHVRSVHERIRNHECTLCGSKFRSESDLKVHDDSIHRNIRYPCDQCDYKATQKSSLKTHRVNNIADVRQ